MACKSSKRPRIKRWAASGLAGILVYGGWTAANAQNPTPAPSPTPKPKVAFVRFWNMLPDQKKDTLDLYLAPGQQLTRANAGSSLPTYIPVLPNTYTLFVQRPADSNAAPLKTPTLRMADGSFFTILALGKNGQPSLEVIDDTIDPTKEDGSAHLTVRQYYPGVRAVVTVGSQQPSTLNYGEIAHYDQLPAAEVPVAVQATLADGSTKKFNVSASLTKKHHGSLLIVSDLYGRFRPFFTVDGSSDLNLASVMEHWLQSSARGPILATPNELAATGQTASPPPGKKSRHKKKTQRTRHRKQQPSDDSQDSKPTSRST